MQNEDYRDEEYYIEPLDEQLIKRLKSLAWRSFAMAIVAVGAYILQVGSVFDLDAKILINTASMAFLGLVVGEITKFLNS
jgi:uncharacterized membrane protein